MAATTLPNVKFLAHEDLADTLRRLEPATCPATSMAKVGRKLTATERVWEVDRWGAPSGARGVTDGYAVQTAEIADNMANRRKMANSFQAFRRGFGQGWQTGPHGDFPGGSGVAQAAADQLVILKQEIECAITSTDQEAYVDGGTADTAGLMAGLGKLTLRTNTYAGTTYTLGKIPEDFAPPADAQVNGLDLSALNMALLKKVVKSLRGVTKINRDYAWLCGLDLREQVSALAEPSAIAGVAGNVSGQVRTFIQQVTDAELGSVIDVIRTDFGRLLVLPTDWIGATTVDTNGAVTATRADRVFLEQPKRGYVLPREKLELCYGVVPERKTLAEDGSGEKEFWRCTAGIVVHQPQPFGQTFFA